MRPNTLRAPAVLVAALTYAGSATAQFDHEFRVQPTSERLQTGPTAFSAGTYFMQFSVNGTVPAPPIPYTSAIVTKPDTTTVSLSQFSTNLFVSSFQFSTLAAMQTAYPSGTYSAALSPNGLPLPPIGLPTNYSPPVFPEFTNYDAIRVMDPQQNFTFTFPAFSGSGAFGSQINFAIIETGTGTVVVNQALESTATGATVSAGTLVAGRPYAAAVYYLDVVEFDFIFDEVNLTYINAAYTIPTSINLAAFTPTPEPSAVLAVAGAGLGAAAVRRRKKSAPENRTAPR